MPTYENFWTVTIFRGVLAILIGSAVLIVPDLAPYAAVSSVCGRLRHHFAGRLRHRR